VAQHGERERADHVVTEDRVRPRACPVVHRDRVGILIHGMDLRTEPDLPPKPLVEGLGEAVHAPGDLHHVDVGPAELLT
jgi:hypothetical protein